MQQGTTILQYLTFRPNVSFNDPATPNGKLWNAVLKHVTQTQGWGELDWGARVASEQVVDLLISKINTYFAIPRSYGIFCTSEYADPEFQAGEATRTYYIS